MPTPPRRYYPVFLDLRGKRCVVVGGGTVAERKVLGLLSAEARVAVISPTLTRRLEKEKAAGRIEHIPRRARDADLDGAFLAIAATDAEEVGRAVARAGKDRPVNVADAPELCSFIVPSTVRRGPLHIAVSTSGASPAMARAIRKDLEELYPPAFGRYLRRVRRLREKILREEPDPRKRERLLKALASPQTIRALRRGKTPPVAGGK
jgi:precorrin-2 dehydrogenase/sirohydrochlorin ferrochelatase